MERDSTDRIEVRETEHEEMEQEIQDSSLLIVKAKQATLDKQWDEAVELYSLALQLKLKELGNIENEKSPELASLYLDYGDLLLQKAEHSSDFMEAPKSRSGEKHESSREGLVADSGALLEEEPSDEELAWEVLELARQCFHLKLEAFRHLDALRNEELYTTVKGTVLTYLRLGDILMTQNFPLEAEREYQSALDLLLKFKLPQSETISCRMRVGQARILSGSVHGALEALKQAYELNLAELEAQQNKYSVSYLEALTAIKEDLAIQIKDLLGLIEKRATETVADHQREERMSLFAGQCVTSEPSKNPFDPPVLKECEIVDLGIISGQK